MIEKNKKVATFEEPPIYFIVGKTASIIIAAVIPISGYVFFIKNIEAYCSIKSA